MTAQKLSRRERYRSETRAEAKGIALRQVAAGGAASVSLNAIGKEMGVSGPALYRYFASRDALLTELIVDAYSDLAAAMEAVLQHSVEAAPDERLRGLAAAFRAWALAQPHRYLLLYGTPVPGYVAPPSTIPVAHRIFAPILEALAALPSPVLVSGPQLEALEAQFAQWARERDIDQQISGSVLRRGLVWWTRLHGLISLEIEGHFALMGFDPALLYDTEVDTLLDETGVVDRTPTG